MIKKTLTLTVSIVVVVAITMVGGAASATAKHKCPPGVSDPNYCAHCPPGSTDPQYCVHKCPRGVTHLKGCKRRKSHVELADNDAVVSRHGHTQVLGVSHRRSHHPLLVLT
jgi:hypothetical protein